VAFERQARVCHATNLLIYRTALGKANMKNDNSPGVRPSEVAPNEPHAGEKPTFAAFLDALRAGDDEAAARAPS
jgi:hypothetical protein